MIREFSAKRYNRGAVAVLVALSIVVLLGFVGLALDVGKLFVGKTELQNAADGCALAAARELTGTSSTQLVIAEAAGITAGTRDRVLLQSEAVGMAKDSAVTFSATLNGSYQPENLVAPADKVKMKYAACQASRANVPNWFMQVLKLLPGGAATSVTVSSAAVATLSPSQAHCALPVSVCQKTASAPYGYAKGDWLESVVDSKANITGNFMWAAPDASGNGTNVIRSFLSGPGICNLPAIGSTVGNTGDRSGADTAWNTRFGIYGGSYKGPTDGVPDFTGYAYVSKAAWPNGAYSDFQAKRSTYTAYQTDAVSGLNTQGTPVNTLATTGSDRRIGVVPVVDCSVFASAQSAPVKAWACILMLHPLNQGGGKNGAVITCKAGETATNDRMCLEYLGLSSDPGSPCGTQGTPGGPGSPGPLVPTLVQ